MVIQDLINAINADQSIRYIDTIIARIENFETSQLTAPLIAAIKRDTKLGFETFKILITSYKASLFSRPSPQEQSAIEVLASENSSASRQIMNWLKDDKDSPIFTWNKLREKHPTLYKRFSDKHLIPAPGSWLYPLPIDAAIGNAIATGEMDFIDEVLNASESMQGAGDIHGIAVLDRVMKDACAGRKHAMAVLEYLLEKNADPLIRNNCGNSAIFQVVYAQESQVIKEENVIAVLKLLLKHKASLSEIKPSDGSTVLMEAIPHDPEVFNFLLKGATAETLNHKANDGESPSYLIFRVLEHSGIEERVSLLSDLKKRGVAFNSTTEYRCDVNCFDKYKSPAIIVSAKNASLLHFYVEQMAIEDKVDLNEHLKVIQTLVLNGADPTVKATYTRTPKETTKDLELTAAQYARKLARNIFNHQDAVLLETHPNEPDFLKEISQYSKQRQAQLHQLFHQFKNLERVLSGKSVLPYCGIPDAGKLTAKAQKKTSESVVKAEDFNNIGNRLFQARQNKNRQEWQDLKKSMVDYVKAAETSDEFVERVMQLKGSLQFHFDVTADPKSGAVRYGSLAYRIFHVFDTHQFASSWEKLRRYGQNTWGLDINTPYDMPQLKK